MIEAQCDDDVVEGATEEIEDSEEFEYFYDWLMRQCKEVTQGNVKQLKPYFVRFLRLESGADKEIKSKWCFV